LHVLAVNGVAVAGAQLLNRRPPAHANDQETPRRSLGCRRPRPGTNGIERLYAPAVVLTIRGRLALRLTTWAAQRSSGSQCQCQVDFARNEPGPGTREDQMLRFISQNIQC